MRRAGAQWWPRGAVGHDGAVREHTVELDDLGSRRMVLVLPCGGGDLLDELRRRGVPAVGVDTTEECVQACRAKGHPAWRLPWAQLGEFPERFDAACVDLDALGVAESPGASAALLGALVETVLDGALVSVCGRGAQLDAAMASLPPELAVVHRGESLLRLQRRWRPSASDLTGAVGGVAVSTYADLFVGHGPVLELGAGCGRFLDALRLRDLEVAGVESDPSLAGAAAAVGHRILAPDAVFGSDAMTADGGWGGVFVGAAIEAVDPALRPDLFVQCRRLLRPMGRLVMNVRRRFFPELCEELTAAGFEIARSASVARDPDRGLVIGIAPRVAAAVAPQLPRAVSQLHTRDLPIQQPPATLFDLERFERRVFSQGGEDGLLDAIFGIVGATNRRYVELGGGDGVQCNTEHLRQLGWRGLIVDGACKPGRPDIPLVNAWITAEGVEALMDAHDVPQEPDLLSLDIDGNDYWVWQAIQRRPRVIIAEYNANLPARRALTIPYDPKHSWDGTDFYGASLMALVHVARQKGYTLVYCTQAGVNAVFVRDDLLGGAVGPDPAAIYRPPNYWYRGARSVPNLERRMVEVS